MLPWFVVPGSRRAQTPSRLLPGRIARAMLRPGTYGGYAREALSLAADAAAFPLGLVRPGDTPAAPRTSTAEVPVVLVHGYGHNRSAWFLFAERLRSAGIAEIDTINYDVLLSDIPLLGSRLRAKVEHVLERTGADRVDLIGHSLGGMVARWMIQECGGWDLVRTCVTVATPHEGTTTAALGAGRIASQLRPKSRVIRRLSDTMRQSDVRWVAFYSNIDVLIQPASSAKLAHPLARADNVLVKDRGHFGILFSRRLVDEVAQRLRPEAQSGARYVLPIAGG